MNVVVEMVSDIVCPWCWLGMRRILAAIEQTPEVEVQLLFRPYELDPTIPPEGIDYRAYMENKFGPERDTSVWKGMREALEEYGAAENIPFRFSEQKHRPNSFDAHRLVHWAQGQGKGIDAKEALFNAYFHEIRNIGDHAVLADIAGDIGLDKDIVTHLLASDADVENTRQEEALFQQMGISGVPTYIANRRIAVQGAESAEKLSKFLTTAAQDMPQERPLTSDA